MLIYNKRKRASSFKLMKEIEINNQIETPLITVNNFTLTGEESVNELISIERMNLNRINNMNKFSQSQKSIIYQILFNFRKQKK